MKADNIEMKSKMRSVAEAEGLKPSHFIPSAAKAFAFHSREALLSRIS
jgi:hypothetical protein